MRSPATWLAGILLTVVTVTFQDTLTGAVKAVLPLDRLPDRISPQGAVHVVEVKDVKVSGEYLVRGDRGGRFGKVLYSGQWRQKGDILDVGESEWMVTLEGRAAQQVRITDIVPELEGGKCSPPLGGSLVLSPAQGESKVIPLEVTIDSPLPRLTAQTEGAKAGAPYFTGSQARHITLKQNESEAFLLRAKTERGHCRWRYRIHYQVGGSTAEMVLERPGGKPFEVTGQLSDVGGYRSVYAPSFVCAANGHAPDTWITGTGAEYARALRRGKEGPCPGP
ncbi:hypothetical protein QOM21_13410 [Streptomyces sp. Pv4-95]|uniref:hypothetical protein n=1 Tax=Streptomyces sp. Pv4-95 TaxID=3049543 RepID=UPI003891CEB1